MNIIPDKCSIHVDRRLNSHENWQDSFRELKQTVKKRVNSNLWESILWNKPYLIDPPLTNDLYAEGLIALSESVKKIQPNFSYSGLQFGCDASKIQPTGIPTVVFGPGSITEAHTEDEWIETEELIKAIEIYSIIFQTFKQPNK